MNNMTPHLDDELRGFPHLTRRDRFWMHLYGADTSLLEWLFCALKTTWGLWLALQPHTFAVSPHLYSIAGHLPASAWGALFAGLGLSQGAAWYADARRARWRLALGGALLWFTWAWLLWLADHRTPALVGWGTLAAFQGLAAVILYGRSHIPKSTPQAGGANQGGGKECPPLP